MALILGLLGLLDFLLFARLTTTTTAATTTNLLLLALTDKVIDQTSVEYVLGRLPGGLGLTCRA